MGGFTEGVVVELIILMWLGCAGIGAAITSSKNRGIGEGLALGGLLGLLGVVIAACLSRNQPRPPPGLVAVVCPRCNAPQNVPKGAAEFKCWQCHLHTGMASPPPAKRIKLVCGGCKMNLTMPANTTAKNAKCPKCGHRTPLPLTA